MTVLILVLILIVNKLFSKLQVHKRICVLLELMLTWKMYLYLYLYTHPVEIFSQMYEKTKKW